jgi:hypothetical protein
LFWAFAKLSAAKRRAELKKPALIIRPISMSEDLGLKINNKVKTGIEWESLIRGRGSPLTLC